MEPLKTGGGGRGRISGTVFPSGPKAPAGQRSRAAKVPMTPPWPPHVDGITQFMVLPRGCAYKPAIDAYPNPRQSLPQPPTKPPPTPDKASPNPRQSLPQPPTRLNAELVQHVWLAKCCR